MTYLIRYGEIHLKGLNRPHFEKLLRQSIRRAVGFSSQAKVEKGTGRFYVTGVPEQDQRRVETALLKVFGIHSISPVETTGKTDDLRELKECAARQVSEYMRGKGLRSLRFKVEAKRADKSFRMRSMDIAADVGGYVLQHVPGTQVDVHDPQLRVYVEVREACHVYTKVLPGAGGLPQRSAGRGMLLLSGGIDSPVAGYDMARRGLELNAVHYHSFPYTSEAAKEKVIRLARILSDYAGKIYLHVVGFTRIQDMIRERCPQDMLVLIMRRFMMRIAEQIAEKNACLALITGENLGQVASQTLESLCVTDQVVEMPVFRPLIAHDKLDIIRKAEEIGTYETSIEPFEDCCTVFVPKHPQTRPHPDRIAEAESALPVQELVREAVDAAELLRVSPLGEL